MRSKMLRRSNKLREAGRVIEHWLPGAFVSTLGHGHIHDTYLAEARNTKLVIQRINHYVFSKPDLVMAQTERLLECWSLQNNYVCPRLVRTQEDKTSVRQGDNTWRAWHWLPGETIDPPENTAQVYAAAKAFALLQIQLSGLAGPALKPTIERFLDLSFYLAQFEKVATFANPSHRAVIHQHQDLQNSLGIAKAHIHGDCKVDNLLFAADRQSVVAILDFDTAMYGDRALDFGDLIRSVGVSCGRLDPDMYRAALAGFVQGGVGLTVNEAVAAPSYVTFMLAVRFLTDHLQGDVYFKTTHAGENEERANRQFRLLARLKDQAVQIRTIAEEVCCD